MIFGYHRPKFPLGQYVDSMVYFEKPAFDHTLDRFLPDGNTELLIDLTDGVQHIYDNEKLTTHQTCQLAWVSGIRTSPITIPSGKNSRMLVVTFRKGGARSFYDVPMHELTNHVVPADAIWGHRILSLRENLLEQTSPQAMFSKLEDFLLTIAGDRLVVNSAEDYASFATGQILAHPSELTMQNLSRQIGFSQKHMIKIFKDHVGLSPKSFLRVIRFQTTLTAMTTQEFWGDGSGFALRHGYYDQSHFIHDFKTFSGFTPSQYWERKSENPNYVPVF
jgi:AraC-like DNA-binding protein